MTLACFIIKKFYWRECMRSDNWNLQALFNMWKLYVEAFIFIWDQKKNEKNGGKKKKLYFRCFISEKGKTQTKKNMCLVWRGYRNRMHVLEIVCKVLYWWFFLDFKWIQVLLHIFTHWHLKVSAVIAVACIYIILNEVSF